MHRIEASRQIARRLTILMAASTLRSSIMYNSVLRPVGISRRSRRGDLPKCWWSSLLPVKCVELIAYAKERPAGSTSLPRASAPPADSIEAPEEHAGSTWFTSSTRDGAGRWTWLATGPVMGQRAETLPYIKSQAARALR